MFLQEYKYFYLCSSVFIGKINITNYIFFAKHIFAVNILVFGGALNFTWTSPVFPKLTKPNNPIGHIANDEETSWIGSLLPLGSVLGPFVWGYLADAVGRKYTLLLLNVPFTIAYIMLALAETVELYYAARFIAGFALSGLYIIVPMYFVEICDLKIRGILSSTLNLFVTLGTIFTYAVGPFFDIMPFTLICLVFPLIFFVLGFVFLVETPFYLLKQGKYNRARKSLMLYRGVHDDKIISEELERIEVIINEKNDVTFTEIVRSKNIRRGLFISLMLLMFQQCSGNNIILFNTETIFIKTKSSIPADMSSLLMGVTSFIFAFVSTALVDKLGRKILLVISGIGMFISELSMGVYFYLLENGKDVSDIYWLPILSLLTYMGSYNIGFGPLPWVILAEVLPDNIKNKLSPIGPTVCCLIAFILSKLYPNLTNLLHLYGTFWLFTTFNAFAIVFTLFVLPETKGKTFQEIQQILSGKT